MTFWCNQSINQSINQPMEY